MEKFGRYLRNQFIVFLFIYLTLLLAKFFIPRFVQYSSAFFLALLITLGMSASDFVETYANRFFDQWAKHLKPANSRPSKS